MVAAVCSPPALPNLCLKSKYQVKRRREHNVEWWAWKGNGEGIELMASYQGGDARGIGRGSQKDPLATEASTGDGW